VTRLSIDFGERCNSLKEVSICRPVQRVINSTNDPVLPDALRMNERSPSRLKKTNVAAFENFLTAKYERLAGISQARSVPYIMDIDPTSICQLRCPLCPTGANNARRKAGDSPYIERSATRLERGVLDSILDECGDLLFYCHFFNWGEPLLNENLPQFIRSAHERNIYTKFDTNFSLRYGDKKLKDLILSGLDELAVSIDGFSQQTYEQYRVGGRFDLAFGNLKRLVKMRDQLGIDLKVSWNFIIFSFNEHEMNDVAAFCQDQNINFVPKHGFIPRTGKYSDWLPTYRREESGLRSRGVGLYRPLEVEQSSDWTTPFGVLPTYPGRPEGRTCAWHYSYTSVNADGAVPPCCVIFNPKFALGRVTAKTGSFGKVWNNDNFQTIRRDFPASEETEATGPATACTQCAMPEDFRDCYTQLDREIMRRYWSFAEGSEVRQLDEFYRLLQQSPSEFATAYAVGYNALAARELVCV
jgi:MoaA/NifB/PqqE/SkfB family radical SAM enzyme